VARYYGTSGMWKEEGEGAALPTYQAAPTSPGHGKDGAEEEGREEARQELLATTDRLPGYRKLLCAPGSMTWNLLGDY
jgi:hypothetical protein